MSSWPPFLFIPIPHFFFEPEIFKDPGFFQFLCFALERTNRREESQYITFHGQTVILEMGEFIFGRLHWAQKLQVTESKVRSYVCRLDSQQIAGKVSSKTTSKMSVYRWLWEYFPESSRRQNHQQVTSTTPVEQPQSKNKTIDIETTTGAAAVFSEKIDATSECLLSSLPMDEQTAILEHLQSYRASNKIKNIGGWLRRCIEGGWHKQKQLEHPEQVSCYETNKALARSICQRLENNPEIHCHMFQDLFQIKFANG